MSATKGLYLLITLIILVFVMSQDAWCAPWVTIKAEVTAYTSDSCGKLPSEPAYKVTASGKPVHVGVIAGPVEIPFGTHVYVQGYGYGKVLDRGGAIRYKVTSRGGYRGGYYRFDVFVKSRREALLWGRRIVSVTICTKSLSQAQIRHLMRR